MTISSASTVSELYRAPPTLSLTPSGPGLALVGPTGRHFKTASSQRLATTDEAAFPGHEAGPCQGGTKRRGRGKLDRLAGLRLTKSAVRSISPKRSAFSCHKLFADSPGRPDTVPGHFVAILAQLERIRNNPLWINAFWGRFSPKISVSRRITVRSKKRAYPDYCAGTGSSGGIFNVRLISLSDRAQRRRAPRSSRPANPHC
jgi:hypothetical protein